MKKMIAQLTFLSTKIHSTLFVLLMMLFTSTSITAQQDNTNDDWTNNNISGSQNELNRTAIFTDTEAAGKITFGNGIGSIRTYGLNAESVPLPAGTKGTQMGVRAITSSNYSSQAGYAEGVLGYSKSYIADGKFVGVRGFGRASALNTFDSTSPFSFSLGGYFVGGADTTTLDIADEKVYIGGTYSVLGGTINGTPEEGAIAAVIGVDNSTGTAPSYASYFEGFQNYMTGRLGVGVASPAQRLHVRGKVRASFTNNLSEYVEIYHGGSNGFINTVGDGNLDFRHDNSTKMTIKPDGKVSIGGNTVSTPGDYKLYVDDGILTEKVKVATVNSTDWADYVFEEDYDLNSTEKVAAFIKANKHLPNVPSAKAVSENGIDMVEMDATLLRQIEELWLHVIDLKKENEALNIQIKALKKQ